MLPEHREYSSRDARLLRFVEPANGECQGKAWDTGGLGGRKAPMFGERQVHRSGGYILRI
jgi:hypothetical protein